MLDIGESQYAVRRPEIDESSMVSKLFCKIIESSFPMFNSEMLKAYKANWGVEDIGKRIQHRNDLLMVVWEQDKPIGIVSGGKPEGGVGTIIWLLVAEEYRNASIGVELFKHAISHYRELGCHKLKLTVPSERAKRFYERNGMVIEGFHPNHWWNCDFWSLAFAIT
jgi:ribosomal protein S18 acetylase RimI-like enzyme